MKKTNQSILILASSFFFLPSLFNYQNQPSTLQQINSGNTSQNTRFFSYKNPVPVISAVISYQILSIEEIESIAPSIKIPSDQQLEDWFNKYAQQYSVSAEMLKKIAWCESNYNPNATNGPYAGLFQYSSTTWKSTRESMGEDQDPSLRFNPEESIKTSAFKISAGGIGAWPNCSR